MTKPQDARELLARALKLAGLVSAEGVELLAHAELPESKVGLAASPSPMAEPLLMLVERSPHFTPQALVPPPVADASLPIGSAPVTRALGYEDVPISVVRWDTSAAVIVIEVDPPARAVHRSGLVHAWREGALIVELASAPFAIDVEGLPSAVMLVGEPANASERRGARLYLLRIEGRARASIVPSDLALRAVLSGFACEAWLEAKATDLLRSGTAVGHAAALGLLARLWTPKSASDRTRVLDGEPTVRDRVEADAARMPPDRSIEIARAAIELARELERWLTELGTLAASRPSDAREIARRIIARRDELASIAEYFRASTNVEGARDLDRALERADAEASAQLSAFSVAPELGDDELVLAVHWQEPDAWWGSFVEA
jgi:hypothetical protein